MIDLSQNICYDETLSFNFAFDSYGKHSKCLEILKEHYDCDNIDLGYGISELILRIMHFIKHKKLKLTICNNAWPGVKNIQVAMNVAEGKDVFYIVNPNGIDGTELTKDQIVSLSTQYKYLIVDEAYSDFSNSSVIKHRTPNMIILKTMSKSLASPGVRFGWCFANQEVLDFTTSIRPRSVVVGGMDLQLKSMLLEIPNHAERMIETRDFLQNNFDCKPSCGNYVLFQSIPKQIEKNFIINQSSYLGRMALINLGIVKQCLQ